MDPIKHMTIALKEYGVREIKGKKDNPQILKYFDLEEFKGHSYKDETAWCSAYANWVCKESDLPRSKELTARSWMDVGDETTTPKFGDVVVLWRESPESWKGHVGFFIKETEHYVYVLGGNQSNKVCIQAYPKSRVLCYRELCIEVGA
ncbi:TIGR02594 family protein [Aquimarina litoralis]|uniref:TIGR02594 family protein n=1 Tax=Aquimarina litoralis TaxID=584605 RepID=UPI001C58A706|nr:TIGR02594 family protein [Aquimarina litoralis]MBW1297820.1 TIGR02594 family protein [Aquimarina litoralis]